MAGRTKTNAKACTLLAQHAKALQREARACCPRTHLEPLQEGEKETTSRRLWYALIEQVDECTEAICRMAEGYRRRAGLEPFDYAKPPDEPRAPKPKLLDPKLFEGKTPTTYAQDLEWAYRHFPLKVKPHDAPSSSAWSLREWAREYKNDFFRVHVPKLEKYQAPADPEPEPQPTQSPTVAIVERLERMAAQDRNGSNGEPEAAGGDSGGHDQEQGGPAGA